MSATDWIDDHEGTTVEFDGETYTIVGSVGSRAVVEDETGARRTFSATTIRDTWMRDNSREAYA